MNFPKHCPCGKSYTAAAWAALPNKRIWPDDMGEKDGWTLEQRDCSCGSSIAIDIPNPGRTACG